MDWTEDVVRTADFTRHELGIETRSINCYQLFVKICTREYMEMLPENKLSVISSVFGEIPDFFDETDYRPIDVISRLWAKLPDGIKKAWKFRAYMLNERPISGLFERLPRHLQTDLPGYVKEVLRSDTDKLRRALSRMMTCRIKEKQYSKIVYIPHKIKLENQVQRQLCVPILVLDSLFGRELEKFDHVNELVVFKGRKNQKRSVTFHVASRERLIDIFSFSDLSLAKVYVHEDEYTLSLCPFGILEDRSKIQHKAYAMSETNTHIKFGVPTNAVGDMHYVDIPKPQLISRENPKKGYQLNHCEYGMYRLIQYNPVCINVSKTNIFNVKILSGRICIRDNSSLVAREST